MAGAVIKNGLLVVTDLSGYLHCLDASTGDVHWVYDLLASCWSTPLICGERIFVPDEDGDLAVFALSSRFADSLELEGNDDAGVEEDVLTTWMDSSVYSTPVAANGVLYITSRNLLFAIQRQEPVEQ